MPTPSDPQVTDDEKLIPADAEASDPAQGGDPRPAGFDGISGVPAEPTEQAIQRLEQDNDELRDRFARLAAEYDNFRKRVAREREELTSRAQAGLAGRLLDVLDDLERLLAGDHANAPAESFLTGMELVGRKLWKELEAAGLERLDPQGQPFDPSVHEAVAAVHPADPALDHTVSATFQAGYRFKGALLRPARVQVYADQGPA
jgi:molecular chaperone GrpE